MGRARTGRTALVVLVLLATACGGGDDGPVAEGTLSPSPVVEDPVGFDEGGAGPSPAPSVTPSPPAAKPTTPAPTTEIPTTSPPEPGVDETHPLAMTWDGIDLRVPSARTEMIGFHQSNHDGARNLDAIDGPTPTVVLESRERSTGRRTAADIVVHPDTEIRAPVTGTVVRAGTYTLYCDNMDDFAVIEPEGRPGIEVKMLHIDGVQVQAGDRVEAGVTVLAPRPTKLPFASQVDEISGPENWPHTHLEVVDTSIPDQPNPNSGSDDC